MTAITFNNQTPLTIAEQGLLVLSLQEPCPPTPDAACRNLAFSLIDVWQEIVLGRGTRFHPAFGAGFRMSHLVLEYTGDYYAACRWSISKEIVFCPPPPGKPDPTKPIDLVTFKPRPRVGQARQKGKTCWYYAAALISQRIGKKCPPGWEKRREAERLFSALRKAITRRGFYTEMGSKFGNLAKSAPRICHSKAVPKQPMFKNMGDAGSGKDGDVRRSQKPKFEPISVYASEEEKHLAWSRHALRYLDQMDALAPEHAACRKRIEATTLLRDASPDPLEPLMNAWLVGYTARGLKPSAWHPSHRIDSLVRELWLHGPHLVYGYILADESKQPAKPVAVLKDWRTGVISQAYGWPDGAPRPPRNHAVAIVGADAKFGQVYYIDPIHASGVRLKKWPPVWAISYAELVQRVTSIFGELTDFSGAEPVFLPENPDGLNDYAMYADPTIAYL